MPKNKTIGIPVVLFFVVGVYFKYMNPEHNKLEISQDHKSDRVFVARDVYKNLFKLKEDKLLHEVF